MTEENNIIKQKEIINLLSAQMIIVIVFVFFIALLIGIAIGSGLCNGELMKWFMWG